MRDLGTEDPDDAELEVDRRDELRYMVARDGDSMVCPFQCELCHFRNIQHRDPLPDEPRDDVLLATMRRANLDAFWARESGTVDGVIARVGSSGMV